MRETKRQRRLLRWACCLARRHARSRSASLEAALRPSGTSGRPAHRFAALDADGTVLGWVAATKVSDRCSYAGVVEHSVYVHPDARGRGVATMLPNALIESTVAAGIWTIQSGIFPENAASLAVHARAGFRVIGIRERIGRHHGVWRDTVLVERRSTRIG